MHGGSAAESACPGGSIAPCSHLCAESKQAGNGETCFYTKAAPSSIHNTPLDFPFLFHLALNSRGEKGGSQF